MIELTYDGGTLRKLLMDWAEAVGDWTVPLTEVLEQQLMDARFFVETKKGFWDEQWPPMAESTVKSGRDPSTLLVKSSALLDSLTRDAPGNIFEVTRTQGFVGSSIPHASWQQDGDPDGRFPRPPRPFMGFTEDRADYNVEIFEEYLLSLDPAFGEALKFRRLRGL